MQLFSSSYSLQPSEDCWLFDKVTVPLIPEDVEEVTVFDELVEVVEVDEPLEEVPEELEEPPFGAITMGVLVCPEESEFVRIKIVEDEPDVLEADEPLELEELPEPLEEDPEDPPLEMIVGVPVDITIGFWDCPEEPEFVDDPDVVWLPVVWTLTFEDVPELPDELPDEVPPVIVPVNPFCKEPPVLLTIIPIPLFPCELPVDVQTPLRGSYPPIHFVH